MVVHNISAEIERESESTGKCAGQRWMGDYCATERDMDRDSGECEKGATSGVY